MSGRWSKWLIIFELSLIFIWLVVFINKKVCRFFNKVLNRVINNIKIFRIFKVLILCCFIILSMIIIVIRGLIKLNICIKNEEIKILINIVWCFIKEGINY